MLGLDIDILYAILIVLVMQIWDLIDDEWKCTASWKVSANRV